MGVQVAPENRRNILADLLTVYANAGKTIVFTQTKREADEVAAGIAGVIPSEVSHVLQFKARLLFIGVLRRERIAHCGRCHRRISFRHRQALQHAYRSVAHMLTCISYHQMFSSSSGVSGPANFVTELEQNVLFSNTCEVWFQP